MSPAIESNLVSDFASEFMKPGHDQYVYRHPNGLCVIGLVATHVAFNEEGGIRAIDFNVGRSGRSGLKVTGKRKQNAQQLESYSVLCKVCTKDATYIVRLSVIGLAAAHVTFREEGGITAIDFNELVGSGLKVTGKRKKTDRHGHIAIIMQKPAAWLKVKDTYLVGS